jgi:hypothetical protein
VDALKVVLQVAAGAGDADDDASDGAQGGLAVTLLGAKDQVCVCCIKASEWSQACVVRRRQDQSLGLGPKRWGRIEAYELMGWRRRGGALELVHKR